MIGLVTGLMVAGYTLVYAAVANGGKLAERPWDSWREDAYASGNDGAGGGGSGRFGSLVHIAGKIYRFLPLPKPPGL